MKTLPLKGDTVRAEGHSRVSSVVNNGLSKRGRRGMEGAVHLGICASEGVPNQSRVRCAKWCRCH